VAEPTTQERLLALLWANIALLLGAVGIALLFWYFLRAWHRVGRDPKKGTIVAQYEPEVAYRDGGAEAFSPAAMRYISHMEEDDTAVAAAVVNMAVKGAVVIGEEKRFFGRHDYSVSRGKTEALATLTPEEKALYDELLGVSRDTFWFKQTNHEVVSEAKKKFGEALEKQFKQISFKRNGKALGVGVLLAAGMLLMTGIADAFATGGLSVIWIGLTAAVMVLLIIIFANLLKAPTPKGREQMDAIEGFTLFLEVTEKDRLAFHNPPERTPELFEKYLPYALALGVAHEWAEGFRDVLAAAKAAGHPYAPVWYMGEGWDNIATGAFASDFGSSLSGAISSSSVAPGSSSGAGGGGFSGGGGGGGGGGGW
jgi:uncharacterized membrane protein YgcG